MLSNFLNANRYFRQGLSDVAFFSSSSNFFLLTNCRNFLLIQNHRDSLCRMTKQEMSFKLIFFIVVVFVVLVDFRFMVKHLLTAVTVYLPMMAGAYY